MTGTPGWKRATRALIVALVTGSLFAGVAEAGVLTPILTSTAEERHPAVGDDYMTWSQYPHGRAGRSAVYARPEGGDRFRVSAQGTRGYSGGVDGTTFVYQQVNNGNSNIKLFDAVTRTRTDPPAGVNTERWEWSPTLSGQWLLYGLDASSPRGTRRVILFNLVTQEKRILQSSQTRGSLLVPGQVNGNFAVFWRYGARDGKVFVYDIAAQTTETIQSDRFDYAPSVTTAGDVYWARSGVGCGTRVDLLKRSGGTTTKLHDLARGLDLWRTYANEEQGNSVGVYFDRVNCEANRYDVFRLEG